MQKWRYEGYPYFCAGDALGAYIVSWAGTA
jgi:hypothetical protein